MEVLGSITSGLSRAEIAEFLVLDLGGEMSNVSLDGCPVD
jgi:hypothetical protein